MSTNSCNILIRQPLLAADIVEAELCLWDYQSFLYIEGDQVKFTFHPIPTTDVKEEILTSSVDNNQGSTYHIVKFLFSYRLKFTSL